MLTKAAIDELIPILRHDLKRSFRIRREGYPNVYYLAFLLRDHEWFNTWAAYGSKCGERSGRSRNLYCDLRVGSYRRDQTSFGGLLDNDEELDSVSHIRVPVDDRSHSGLRMSIWHLTDAKYREAVSDYLHKEAAEVTSVDPYRKYPSFQKLPPIRRISYQRAEKVDYQRWTKLCQKLSAWVGDLPKITSSTVEFDASQESKIFVSSERRIIVQHKQVFSFHVTMKYLTRKGIQCEEEVLFNAGSQSELPGTAKLKRAILKAHERLMQQSKARKIHSFSGPVLLYPDPAGVLFHEAVGHRVEGSRLLSTIEGQTFKDQIGKEITPIPIDMYDDPRIKKFKGARCIGSYQFDDEGTEADRADLLSNGILSGYLTSRAPLKVRGHQSNGHGRSEKFQRPVSRMAVTVIESKQGKSLQELRELLLEEIRAQGRPFGMIVYDIRGGETDTTTYDFQAFSGEVAHASLIFPSGREVFVRGVDFVGTPLQALGNIIAVGSEQSLSNGYCGAESGYIPISIISPAVLLSNLELQSKDEDLIPPYVLTKPQL